MSFAYYMVYRSLSTRQKYLVFILFGAYLLLSGLWCMCTVCGTRSDGVRCAITLRKRLRHCLGMSVCVCCDRELLGKSLNCCFSVSWGFLLSLIFSPQCNMFRLYCALAYRLICNVFNGKCSTWQSGLFLGIQPLIGSEIVVILINTKKSRTHIAPHRLTEVV